MIATRNQSHIVGDQPSLFLTDRDVARLLQVSVASVRRWRLLRQGPKYFKIGAAVRYRSEDLSEWIQSRPTGGEREQQP
jgi:predicted DNA-binding transcriptional regulator AlpA